MSQLNQNEESQLLKLAADGNGDALEELLMRHRDRLERIVNLRLDQRLQSRINSSDVLQETDIEAAQRLKE